MEIDLDPALSVKIVAPHSGPYEDLNDYSVVIKLTYNRVSFLFTGDAEASSERRMVTEGTDLQADLLKVGHHGSTTSTSKQFLARVKPKYAVISVGTGNRYGHPDREIINRLSRFQVECTERMKGTILAVSDGESIKIIPGNGRAPLFP